MLQRMYLTLYTRLVLAVFEKFPRSRLFSDRRQISAGDRTAHDVFCKKRISAEILIFFLSVLKDR
jgi:hypothetical protein